MLKVCEKCGQAYDAPPTKNRRYCSRACAGNYDQKVTKACQICGAEFKVFPSKAQRARFCSTRCKDASSARSQMPRIVVTQECPVCGVAFQTTNRLDEHKTCSRKCANKRRGQATAQRDSTIEKTCQECGKSFRVFPSRDNQQYCSRKCKYVSGGKKAAGTIRTSRIRPCIYCGKPVKQFRSRIKSSEQRFCNNECYHAWDAEYKKSPKMLARMAARIANGEIANPSSIEDCVADWLTSHGLNFERQVQLWYRVLDFRVGDTYIEVHGCYWHGCPEHFPDPTEQQRKRMARDTGLQTYCRKHNIPLLVIWEHDIRANHFDSLTSLLES